MIVDDVRSLMQYRFFDQNSTTMSHDDYCRFVSILRDKTQHHRDDFDDEHDPKCKLNTLQTLK